MRELVDADYERLLAFRAELRSFLHWSAETAGRAGLTASLHQLLLIIRGHASPLGPSVGEAAQLLHVRHHSGGQDPRLPRACRDGLVG